MVERVTFSTLINSGKHRINLGFLFWGGIWTAVLYLGFSKGGGGGG